MYLIGRKPFGRLQRYVLRELAGPTLLGLLLYTFVLLMNQFFWIAQQAISKNLGWRLTLEMVALEIPQTLILTIPMATLLGVLIGLGRLSADHEWVALQGAGVGPSFLLRTVALHGLVATLASFGVYALVLPGASYRSRELRGELLLASTLATELRPRVFLTDVPGLVLYVNEIRPGGGQLEGVWIHRNDPATEHEEMFLARTGDLYPSPGVQGGLELDLRDGVFHRYRSDAPQGYQVSTFERYHVRIEPPGYYRSLTEPPPRTVYDMTLAELLQELREARRETEPLMRTTRVQYARTELHQRFALPVAGLAFALLGVPLGITRVRTGKGAGFALSLAVIAVYWVLFTVLRDQATQGRVPPAVGAWAADAVMLAWAGVAYARMRRRGTQEGALTRWAREFARRDWAIRRPRQTVLPAEPHAAEEELMGRTGWQAAEPEPSSRWVSLVDRYVAFQYVRIFVYAIASAYLVYGIIEFKNLFDDLFNNQQPFSLVLAYFKYFAPGMINLVLPVACLIGAVVTFTVLGRSGELTAMKAGGISMRRATFPVLALTAVVCGLFYLVQENIAPFTNRRAQEIKDRIQGRMPRSYGMASGGRWTFGDAGRLYHYRTFDAESGRFQGLTAMTLDWERLRILDHRFAQSAAWNRRVWSLRDGWFRSFPVEQRVGLFRHVEAEDVPLDPPDNFARREYVWTMGGDLAEQMSLTELGGQIEVLGRSGYDTTRLRVAWFAKLAHPLTPFVMVLIGLPFAFRLSSRGSLYSIGVALVLVIVYWATLATFEALGLETVLPPVLAAWAPNVLYGVSGLYLLLFIRT